MVCVERSHSHRLAVIVIALAVGGGCSEPIVPIGSDPGSRYLQVVDIPPIMTDSLDLLFVVDNSETMAGRQLALKYSFARLLSYLEFAEGGLPDLHVGVVSTDMGVGDEPVPGCSFAGDQGRLQAAPRLNGCPTLDGSFLRDYRDGDDRDTNFGELPLDEAFSCISTLGTGGCQFEQPLEAMRRALDGSNPANDGFLRPDAALGVVILTDEDDCSVFDPTMFAPDQYGEISKFRCFANGVTCEGDDVRIVGEYHDCHAKLNSDYMYSVGGYSRFVSDLKFDPESVVVAGIIGDASLVEVAADLDDQPQLVPACESDGALAYPAVRLADFLKDTRAGSEVASLCGDKPLDALSSTALQLRKSLGTRCLDGPVLDVDDDTPGLQVDCHVYDVAPDGTRTELPECERPYMPDTSTVVPCYAIKQGPGECGDFQSAQQLSLQVWRGDWDIGQPFGTHTIGECLVADDG